MMSLKLLTLILVSVSMSALAQISMKYGVTSINSAIEELAGDKLMVVFTMLTSPFVLLGLALYGFGTILWLFVLSKMDVSMAYPFVGVGFILTMVLGAMFLGEVITMPRAIGTILVVAGVVLVAR